MKLIVYLLIIFSVGGCFSVLHRDPRDTHKIPSDKEAAGALTSVAGYYAGRKLSESEIQELSIQVQKDKEAQKAIEQLSEALTGEDRPPLRYCPVDGRRFSHRVEVCPEHKVRLKELDPENEIEAGP